MALSVVVHSIQADGSGHVVTLVKTGADTGVIYIADVNDTSKVDSYKLWNVRVAPVSHDLTCNCSVSVFTADVVVRVSAAAPNKKPSVDIIISGLLFGNGTYSYPVEPGEDALVRQFLDRAQFPPPA